MFLATFLPIQTVTKPYRKHGETLRKYEGNANNNEKVGLGGGEHINIHVIININIHLNINITITITINIIINIEYRDAYTLWKATDT